MRELDDEANKYRARIEDARYRRKQIYDGHQADGNDGAYELISGNIEEVKKIRNDKREKIDRLNILKDRMNELDKEKQAILRSVPRNYQNEKDLAQAIKEKQTRYETTSLNSNEEKLLLKDIDKLKKALPEMKKLTSIDPELVKIRDERKVISADLDVFKQLIDEREVKINDSKQKNDEVRGKRTEVRERADVVSKDIDEGNEALRNAYSTKDKMRESYFKQLYEFELQADKMRYLKGMYNQQKKMKQVVTEKADRIEKKREEIKNRPNPYQKEIDTCDHLVLYCQRLRAQHGLVPATSEEVAKKIEKDSINQFNK